MKRLRLGLDGRMFGFLPVHWTLIATDVPEELVGPVGIACGFIDGRHVKGGNILEGVLFAELKEV